MDWFSKTITQAGGTVGAILGYITIGRTLEVIFYALIGAAVGEGVKEMVKWYKRKKGFTNEK